ATRTSVATAFTRAAAVVISSSCAATGSKVNDTTGSRAVVTTRLSASTTCADGESAPHCSNRISRVGTGVAESEEEDASGVRGDGGGAWWSGGSGCPVAEGGEWSGETGR